MRLFRLRAVVVQAVQVTGHNWDDLDTFCGPERIRRRVKVRGRGANTEPGGIIGEVWSTTHQVWLPFRVGDWIEHGPYGDLQPVRSEHRAARYQPLHG